MDDGPATPTATKERAATTPTSERIRRAEESRSRWIVKEEMEALAKLPVEELRAKIEEDRSMLDLKMAFEYSTLLQNVAKHGSTEAVEMLVDEYGMDPHASPDKYKSPPLLYAMQRGNIKVVELLMDKYQADPTKPVNSLGANAVHYCAEGGCVDLFRSLVEERGMDIHHITNEGASALHYATMGGQLEIVKILVKKGFDLKLVSSTGINMLHVACRKGHTELVRELIDVYGLDPLAVNNEGRTIVHEAASEGHEQLVSLLVNHYGVNAHAKNEYGQLALNMAAWAGEIKMVDALVEEYGLDVHNVRPDKQTVLHEAVAGGRVKMVDHLVEKYGLDIHQPYKENENAIHAAARGGRLEMMEHLVDKYKLSLESKSDTGWTALHGVAFAGNTALFALLVKRGMDPLAKNKYEQTMLHLAAQGGHTEMCALVLDYGIELEAKREDGWTAVHEVAWCGEVHCLDFLVEECGADVHRLYNNEGNAIHAAAAGGHAHMIKHLVTKYGLNIDHRRDDGWHALHIAARSGHHFAITALVELGCDLNVVTNIGATLIHLAAQGGRINTIEWLMENYGLDVNSTRNDKWIALHEAAWGGHVKLLEHLVHEYGQDVDQVDQNGDPPIDLALYAGHPSAVHALLKMGASLEPLLKTPPTENYKLQPTKAVLKRGPDALRMWVDGAQSEARDVLKVLVLGHGRAGKTTMIRAIDITREHKASRTRSTIGVDVNYIRVKGMPSTTRVVTYDFAGQTEYSVIHSHFFSRRNVVYLIVVDSSQGRALREAHLRYWMTYVQHHLEVLERRETGKNMLGDGSEMERSVEFLVVGTQVDKLRRKEDRDECLQDMSRIQRELLGKKVGQPLLLSGTDESIGDGVKAVSQRLSRAAERMKTNWGTKYVPASFVEADRAFEERFVEKERGSVARGNLFVDVKELGDVLGVETAIGVEEAQYLHQIGSAALSPKKTKLCTNPRVLSKLFSPFVCSDEHARTLDIGAGRRMEEQAVITLSEAHMYVKRILELEKMNASDIVVRETVETMGEWSLWARVNVTNAERYELYNTSALKHGDTERVLLVLPSRRPICAWMQMPSRTKRDRKAPAVPEKLMDVPPPEELGAAPEIPTAPTAPAAQAAPPSGGDNETSCDDSPGGVTSEQEVSGDAAPDSVAAATAQNITQNDFNQVQVMLFDVWHPEYALFVNGLMLASDVGSDGKYDAVGMVVRQDNGTVRVLTQSKSGGAAHGLIQKVICAFVEAGAVARRRWTVHGEVEAKRMIGQHHTTRDVPWKWVAGEDFEECERHRWATFDEKKADELGIDVRDYREHRYWRHLTDDQLVRLGVGTPEEVARMNTEQRAFQLTPQQAKLLDDDEGVLARKAELSDLEYTELVPGLETHPARKMELDRAVERVTRFVGKDAMKNMVVHRVVAFKNRQTEREFLACYHEMKKRMERSVELFGPSPWETNTKGQRERLQRHTMNLFETQCIRDVGCDDVNLMIAYHGAREQFQFLNAGLGFRKIKPLAEHEIMQLKMGNPSRLDFGFFGRGVYLSQFPSYGVGYAQGVLERQRREGMELAPESALADSTGVGDRGEPTAGAQPPMGGGARQAAAPRRDSWVSAAVPTGESASSATPPSQAVAEPAAAQEPAARLPSPRARVTDSSDGEHEDEVIITFPLMMSYCLLGRAYPVTERSDDPYDVSLHGKSCVQGYDSHYAVVSGRYSEMEPVRFQPDGSIEEEAADEICLFSPAQVYPQMLVYVSEKGAMAPPSGQKPLTIWVDPKEDMADIVMCSQWIAENTCVEVRHAKRTVELISWLRSYERELKSVIERRHLRVVTNRYRAFDGGEDAAGRLIRRLRREPQWAQIEVLVYCGRIGPALPLYNPDDNVYLTTSEPVAVDFLSMEPISIDVLEYQIEKIFHNHPDLQQEKKFPKSSAKVCEEEYCTAKFGLIFGRKCRCHLCGRAYCDAHAPHIRFAPNKARICAACLQSL